MFCRFVCASDIVGTENIITPQNSGLSLIPGQKSAVSTPLLNPEKVSLPPLLHQTWTHKFPQGNGSKQYWIDVHEK
jgi:hypothetical protein